MSTTIVVNGGELNGETFFTSEDEIRRVFSNDGVENHLENLTDYPIHMAEVIDRATSKVLLYLRGTYSLTDMETNVWVREKATYIACYLISIRSGNPSLYGAMYEESLIELTQARTGQIDPGLNSNARAVLQTPMLDNRGYAPGLRTDPRSSTVIKPSNKLPMRFFNGF